MRIHPATILFVTIAAMSPAAAAQDCLRLAGGWHRGPTSTAAVEGEIAVMGEGAYLQVVDVANPRSPKVRGEVLLPDVPRDVVLSGGYAFVTTGVAGLVVVDVQDPMRPRVVSTKMVSHELDRISLDGDLLVASEPGWSDWVDATFASGRIHVFDVGTPSQPNVLANYGLASRGGKASIAQDIALFGTQLLVAERSSWFGDTTLRVVDLSSPRNPIEVTLAGVPAEAVAAAGGFGFAVGWSFDQQEHLLSVIDLKNPANPVVAGETATSFSFQSMAAAGDYLYATNQATTDVVVFDVSAASRPREVATVGLGLPADDPSATPSDIDAAGALGVVAVGPEGLRVLDLTRRSRPTIAGSLAASRPTSHIEVEGDVGFLAHGSHRQQWTFVGGPISIVDLSNPGKPTPVARIDLQAIDIAVGGKHLYVVARDTAHQYDLYVFDVNDPKSPTEVAVVRAPPETRGWEAAAYGEGYVYVVGGGALSIYDVSEPSSPQLAGSAAAGSGGPVEMETMNGRLYVLKSTGLSIADVSNPANVNWVASNFPGWGPSDLAVTDTLIFVTDRSDRQIRVQSAADGALIFKTPTSGAPYGVVVNGSTVLVAEEGIGVRSFVETNPRIPSATSLAPGRGYDLEVVDGTAFVASGRAGLSVLETGCGAPSTNVFLPVAVSADGIGGTRWTTDLEVANTSDRPTSAWFRLLPRFYDNNFAPNGEEQSFAPGQVRRYHNIWGQALGDGAGAIMIQTSEPGSLVAGSRTYNTAASGTFGQGIPMVTAGQMFGAGKRARLVQLSQTADFRTNLGFLNLGAEDLVLQVDFYSADGSFLGGELVGLAPLGNAQLTEAFRLVTPNPVADAWVEVTTDDEDGQFYAYASVVDNRTGDPTTILPRPAGGLLVPAAASATGIGGSQWTTDLELNNLSQEMIAYRFRLLPRGKDNRDARLSERFNLAPGLGARYRDIWGELAGDGAGAIEVVTESPEDLLVMSRTYNTSADGTFGQGIPGITADELFESGEVAKIFQLIEDADFRSNLGFVNATEETIQIEVSFFDGDEALGVDWLKLKPLSNSQWSEAFSRVTSMDVSLGSVKVRATTPGARFYVYGSVIDNRTGDPTTVLSR